MAFVAAVMIAALVAAIVVVVVMTAAVVVIVLSMVLSLMLTMAPIRAVIIMHSNAQAGYVEMHTAACESAGWGYNNYREHAEGGE